MGVAGQDGIGSEWFLRVGSALFYGFASFFITVVNKTVLTSYAFPSFQVLAIGQMFATVVLLLIARNLGILTFPAPDMSVLRKIWPLPLIYVGNVVFGLGGTKELSLPMLAVLRRFSILMTMLAELYFLGLRPGIAVQISVYTMIFGAAVAAADDLAFSFRGYALVLMNDVCTAAGGVVFKRKLDAAELGKYGLLFYNSLLMLPPCIFISWVTGDLSTAARFTSWNQPNFLIHFALSCVMGFILTYSILLCTLHNSALTTTVVGCLKNICITYLGMIIGGDYLFSWLNFVGINISVAGSLAYSWVTFRPKEAPKSSALVTV